MYCWIHLFKVERINNQAPARWWELFCLVALDLEGAEGFGEVEDLLGLFDRRVLFGGEAGELAEDGAAGVVNSGDAAGKLLLWEFGRGLLWEAVRALILKGFALGYG